MFYMEEFMNRLYGLVIMSLLATLSTFAMEQEQNNKRKISATEQSTAKRPRIELEAGVLTPEELKLFMKDIESGQFQASLTKEHQKLQQKDHLSPQQFATMINFKDILNDLTSTTFGLKKEKQ